jgi:uncharacterized protein (DUF305 family)
MNRRRAAFAVAAALVTAGCGADGRAGAAGTANGADRAFVAMMVPHHESAVTMAGIAQHRGESVFVTELAGEVMEAHTKELVILRREDASLAAAGVDIGRGARSERPAIDQDATELSTVERFDPAFIKLMISHRQRASEIAGEELEDGGDPELKGLAQSIVERHQSEIERMRGMLASIESDATP